MKIIPITETNTQFYHDYNELIMEEIKKFTQKTGESGLTTLPLTTTPSPQIINALIGNKFLPEVNEEFGKLLSLFNEEKPDTKHRNPFKFNGLALALSIMNIYHEQLLKTRAAATKAGSGGHAATAPDLTDIPQIYFIRLAPHPQSTTQMGWAQKPQGLVLQSNPYCPSDKRTHLRTVDGRALDNTNKLLLTYTTEKIENVLSVAMHTAISRMTEYLAFLKGETTAPGTYIHKVEEPGKYLYYELQKSVLEEEVSVHPERTSCKVKVHLYVIKRYAEDGICDRVYVEYSYGDLPENTDGDNPCSNTVDIPLVLKTKYVDNVKKELSAKITGFENAISLTFDRQRGEPAQATQTITAPRILSRGEHAGICTLMISPPISGGPKWDVAQATTIQSDAFRAVQEYITSNPLSINQIKVFSISNLDKSIHVHIIVKKIGDNNTLISAEYVSDNGETYELFNNQQSAIQRADEKKIHHQQVSASGPSTTSSYSKSSY